MTMQASTLRSQSRLDNHSCGSLSPNIWSGCGVPSINVSAASSELHPGPANAESQGSVFFDPLGSKTLLPTTGLGSLNGSTCEELPAFYRGRAATFATTSSISGYEELRTHSGPDSEEEEKIKGKLKFFFFNPMDKYLVTRRLPWKLFLQILKAVIVTVQLWIYADYRYAHTNYYNNQATTMEHMFIKEWDQAREIQAYPPATGKLALYRKSDFFDFVDFAVTGWASIERNSLGPFFRNSSMGFCVEHYRMGSITRDLVFSLDTQLVEHCIYLQDEELNLFNTSQEWMKEKNFTVPWYAVERLYLNFSLTSISLSPLGPDPQPDCFQFKTHLRFDNKDHDGQIPVSLDIKPSRIQCSSSTPFTSDAFSKFTMLLNILVIVLCLSSLFLCLRSLLRAELLKYETGLFLERNYGSYLTTSEKLEFLNLWYVTICVNDILIIVGSAFKLALELKSTEEDYWDICSLMLGTGNLLIWLGLLRYLGFFKTYNVLILTIKGAAPNIVRFLICTALLYFGFAFAGWSILGPYHFKFASLMSTSECLFSLINGDDMYATFNYFHFHQSPPVWVYSRVYLYTFIGLFIYLVLSLFISIIMDTYEIIKIYYKHGFPQSRLQQFYASADFDLHFALYSGESSFDRILHVIRRSWRFNYHGGYEGLD